MNEKWSGIIRKIKWLQNGNSVSLMPKRKKEFTSKPFFDKMLRNMGDGSIG